MKDKLKNICYVAFKISISLFFLYYLFHTINIETSLNKLKNIKFSYSFLGLTLLVLSHFLCGIRSFLISRIIKAKISFQKTIYFIFIGQFFNQLLPSSVGGDVVRIALISKEGIAINRASSSIICDRFIGLLITLCIPYFAFLLLKNHINTDMLPIYNLAKIMCYLALGILIFLFFFACPGKKFMRYSLLKSAIEIIFDLKKILFICYEKWTIILISLLIQTLNVLIFYLLAKAMDIQFPIEFGFIIIPMVLFITAMPISFAGWGIRENAMITSLSLIGINAESGMSISLGYGLLLLFSSLPGLFFWLNKYR